MRQPLRRALVWVIVPALAFRALTALYVELQGPLHFHLDDDRHEHHDHAHSERHYHPAGDPTVVTLEDGLDAHAHEEEAAPGWSATMCVAAVSAQAWPHPPPLHNAFAVAAEARFQTRSLGRPERPPRPAAA